MATTARSAGPASSVDYLVDENGSRIDDADDSRIRRAFQLDETVGAGPTHWWRRGLIALGGVAAVLLLLRILDGTPETDLQPGTPVAAPEIVAPIGY